MLCRVGVLSGGWEPLPLPLSVSRDRMLATSRHPLLQAAFRQRAIPAAASTANKTAATPPPATAAAVETKPGQADKPLSQMRLNHRPTSATLARDWATSGRIVPAFGLLRACKCAMRALL